MNDFTQEELIILFLNLCVSKKTKPLLDKISEMIGNYCEHKEPKCMRCGHGYYRNE